MSGEVIDLFSGPRGWSEGLKLLGLSDFGLEIDEAACATAYAAGHASWLVDVAKVDPRLFVGLVWGLIASPPCTDFSSAGRRAGRSGETGHLVDIPPVWVEALRPEWVACEQVPEVLPIWKEHAARYRELGYSTWCGLLHAEQYGVPQTRTRAILMASRTRPALPPEPTHQKYRPGEAQGAGAECQPSMFGPGLSPWVSMADALGWPGEWAIEHIRGDGMQIRHGERDPRPAPAPAPAPTITTGFQRRMRVLTERQAHGATRQAHQPAMTITASADNGNFRWVLDRRQQDPDGSPVPPVPPVPPDRPAPSLTATAGAKSQWVWRRPATTVLGDPRLGDPGHRDREGGERQFSDDTVRLTLEEALTLQSFRPDYPVAGNKSKRFEQVGNAIPPLLAAHICAALTGRTAP